MYIKVLCVYIHTHSDTLWYMIFYCYKVSKWYLDLSSQQIYSIYQILNLTLTTLWFRDRRNMRHWGPLKLVETEEHSSLLDRPGFVIPGIGCYPSLLPSLVPSCSIVMRIYGAFQLGKWGTPNWMVGLFHGTYHQWMMTGGPSHITMPRYLWGTSTTTSVFPGRNRSSQPLHQSSPPRLMWPLDVRDHHPATNKKSHWGDGEA